MGCVAAFVEAIGVIRYLILCSFCLRCFSNVSQKQDIKIAIRSLVHQQ